MPVRIREGTNPEIDRAVGHQEGVAPLYAIIIAPLPLRHDYLDVVWFICSNLKTDIGCENQRAEILHSTWQLRAFIQKAHVTFFLLLVFLPLISYTVNSRSWEPALPPPLTHRITDTKDTPRPLSCMPSGDQQRRLCPNAGRAADSIFCREKLQSDEGLADDHNILARESALKA